MGIIIPYDGPDAASAFYVQIGKIQVPHACLVIGGADKPDVILCAVFRCMQTGNRMPFPFNRSFKRMRRAGRPDVADIFGVAFVFPRSDGNPFIAGKIDVFRDFNRTMRESVEFPSVYVNGMIRRVSDPSEFFRRRNGKETIFGVRLVGAPDGHDGFKR